MAAVEGAGSPGRGVQVLILTGTRERALQISAAVRSLTLGRKGLGYGVVVAGQSAGRQAAILKDKPVILIGTPGRLREIVDGGLVSRDGIRTVLLDGADDLLEAFLIEGAETVLEGGGTHGAKGRAFFHKIPQFIVHLTSPLRCRVISTSKS